MGSLRFRTIASRSIRNTQAAMDRLLRFSDYDVFAYLSSGLATFVVVDLAFSTGIIIGADWDAAQGTITVLMAYPVGHMVAEPAAYFLERKFVRQVLRPPSKILLEDVPLARRSRWRRIIFANYHSPAPCNVVASVMRGVRQSDTDATIGEAIFWIAHPVAQRDEIAYPRMQSFLNLYGFCRNLAFVAFCGGLLIGGLMIYASLLSSGSFNPERGLLAAGILLASAVLFLRYLKFHRLYTLEALVAFAAFQEKRENRAGDN